jgi:hypothetical protein
MIRSQQSDQENKDNSELVTIKDKRKQLIILFKTNNPQLLISVLQAHLNQFQSKTRKPNLFLMMTKILSHLKSSNNLNKFINSLKLQILSIS